MKVVSMTLRYTKTVKVDLTLSDDCAIKDIQISGDFFVYPEDVVESLENSLRECKTQSYVEIVFTMVSNAVILGFDPVDLKKKITEVLESCVHGVELGSV